MREVDVDHLDLADLLDQFPDLFIIGHMDHGHRIKDDETLFLCQIDQFFGLTVVSRKRFFHDDVLAVFQGLFGNLVMGGIRNGHIDDVDLRIA